jgi:transcriptional regulator with GAF, ATPase, and Fis domain
MDQIQTSLCVEPVAVQSDANRPVSNQNTQQPGQSGFSFSSDSLTLRSHRTQAEIHAIRQALARTGWIRKRAARLLAISYRSLLYKIERYKITPPVTISPEAPEMMTQPQNPGQAWRVG